MSLSEGTACAKAGALVGVTGLWTGRLCVAQILNREQWWSPGLLMGGALCCCAGYQLEAGARVPCWPPEPTLGRCGDRPTEGRGGASQ